MRFIYYLLLISFISISANALSLPPDKFVLAPGVNDYTTTQSAFVLEHIQPSGGIFFIYTDTPSQIINKDTGKQVTPVVRNNGVLELTSSFGLFNIVELGIGVPFVLFQNVDGLNYLGEKKDNAVMNGLGDISLAAKGKLFSLKSDSVLFGTALSLGASVPTGTSVGNAGPTFMPGLLLETKFKRVDLGLNAGFRFMKDQGFAFENQKVAVDGEFVGSLGARVKIIPEVSFAGDLLVSTPDGKQVPVELFVGPEINLPHGFKVKGMVGAGLTQEVGAPAMRVIAGLSWSPQWKSCPGCVACNSCCSECEPKVIEKEVIKEVYVVEKEIYLPPVYFETDKDYVMSQSIPILERTIKVMKDNPNITYVIINAHADSRGSAEYNMRLTERRAKYVYDYLVNGGVNPSRLNSISFGENNPADDNKSKVGRDRNRRVEFEFNK